MFCSYSIALVECEGSFPALNYDGNLCTIPSSYTVGTYLKIKGPLYRRQGVVDLFSFLETSVIAQNEVGWISGPPGCGKSVSSFAFSMGIDRRVWEVSFICCAALGYCYFVHFEENKKSQSSFTDDDGLSDLLMSLSKNKDCKRKHILFVDGVFISKTSQAVTVLLSVCTTWYQDDTDYRRLVFISSMAGRSNLPTNIDEVTIEPFTLYSWTLDEYKSAIAVDEVWINIKDAMEDCHLASTGTTDQEAPTRYDLLASKHHFAGGSCRFMFQKSTKQVISCIYSAIDRVTDFQSYAEKNIGDRSVGVVNSLYGCYEGHGSSIISAFALTSIAIKRGPQLINQIIEITKARDNPAMHGELLECWFFLSIQHNGIDVIDRNNSQLEHWNKCNVYDLDPNHIIALSSDPVWYRPIKHDQGGYDAVYVDKKNKLTRFVQVTKASKHSFKIRYFRDLMDQFRNHFETTILDICFLTPMDIMNTFKITPVEGEGLLHAFHDWEKGKETQSARILGAQDFRSFC